jgi:4-hydroxy-3-polyprenylbenzoate decarboxylase
VRELATEIPSDLRLPEGFSKPQLALPGVLVVEGPGVGGRESAVGERGTGEVRQETGQILSTQYSVPSTQYSVPITKGSAPHSTLARFCESVRPSAPINRFPLIVLVDDSDFAARNLNNFLWVTFTRANPAADIHGVGEFIERKHWGCTGPLVIDARIKPHHAPPLVEDPEVTKRIDALAARGGPLARWL